MQYQSMYKTLAQQVSSTSVQTLLENTGSNNGQMIYAATVTVCNRSSNTVTMRLGVARNGEANNQTKQFLYYDLPFTGNNTFAFALDIGLEVGDSIFWVCSSTDLSATVSGLLEPNRQ